VIRGVLLLAAAVAVAIALAGTERPEPRAPSANPLLVRLQVGENLAGLTAGTGDVWVNDFGREQLLRLSGRSGRVVARFPPGRRIAVAVDRRSVWALRWGGRFFRTPNGPLYRIDPATNRITMRIPLDREQIYFGVLSGNGGTWVWGPRHVMRIEPFSGFVLQGYDVGDATGELTGAVLYEDGLLATTADGHLLRLGPAAGVRLGPRVPALERAELLAVDRGIALAAVAGALVAVDARPGRPRWRRPLGFRISTMLDRDGILLAHGAAFHDPGDRLWAIDAATGRVLASTVVPSFGTTSMATNGRSLWFATAAGEVIVVPHVVTRLFLARARSAYPERIR
jgi:outer membrane protein assembly factor BamB